MGGRARTLGCLLAVLLLAAVACSPGPPNGYEGRCVSFDGERVDFLRWSPDGTSLAVATAQGQGARGVIRRLDWPVMKTMEIARGPDVDSFGVAYSEAGIAWVQFDGQSAEVWIAAGGPPERLYRIPAPPVAGLHAAAGRFLAFDGQADGGAIVEVAERRLSPVVEATDGIVGEKFDVSPDGERLVYEWYGGPGTAMRFVLRTSDGREHVVEPLGRLVGNPVLGPEPDRIYYEDHSAGELRSITLGGEVETVLAQDVSEIAVASDGKIAHTFVDPSRTHLVCVLER